MNEGRTKATKIQGTASPLFILTTNSTCEGQRGNERKMIEIQHKHEDKLLQFDFGYFEYRVLIVSTQVM